jgi:2'-5' RNA ligase
MPGSEKGARLFVALDPPWEVRTAAAEWGRESARTGKGMRALGADRTHITLAFLGYRDPDEAEAIAEVISGVARPVEDLALGAPLWLPKRRPRALAIAINRESGDLDELRADLVAELGRVVGWRPENRSFLPHLTAVRTGRGFRPTDGPLPPTPALDFAGESITLYRSTLSPEGARYEALASTGLA